MLKQFNMICIPVIAGCVQCRLPAEAGEQTDLFGDQIRMCQSVCKERVTAVHHPLFRLPLFHL